MANSPVENRMIVKNAISLFSGGFSMAKRISAFLGANTPKGFVSLFDELYNPYTTKNAYIIKGGPGTGKSSFIGPMRNFQRVIR